MCPKTTPEPSDPRSNAASGAEAQASFEELLERLLAIPTSRTDGTDELDEALVLIAGFFGADCAVLRLEGEPENGSRGPASAPGATPILEVPVAVVGREPIATIALYGTDRESPWTDIDASRLGLAAWTVCEVLRNQRVELELREKQIWLLMAMESASVGVWDWDVGNDRVRFISPFDEHGTGLRIRETEGSSWFDTTHPEDVVVSRPEVDRAISGEKDAFSMVVRQRVAPGQDDRWAHIYSRGRVIERDPDGRARRIMGTFEDVTEAHRKAAAEKAREAAMARTARMASLGALASSLAHDLNQPLTALTSYLEGSVRMMAKGQVSDVDVVEALERSVAFAHRAADIVRRFRRLLQREAPLRDPVDLGSLLLEVRDRLQREAAAAGVEIVVAEGPDPVVVRGDGLQIEEVVVNLGRNAVEALLGTSGSSRTVTLDVREPDGLAEVRVADTGPGIPEGLADRLFEPLATTKEAGRGLGLAICHSIAEIHGGRLTVERTGPDGTTFVLALPRDDGGGP
ncbi:MAG: ATP-binding protein [Thermoanaerobaculales bacterium]|jgi:signal transduction histidine kinase|nr:ATP-binding protein [Thermoanaerobaculales bacterium]